MRRVTSDVNIEFYKLYQVIWGTQCKSVSSGIGGHRRPRSDCASAQSDQGLHCPLTESVDTTECIIGEQMPG